MSKKLLVAVELEVQDNQMTNGDIEEWVDVVVVQHFDDEMVWMSIDPLTQMIRILRDCPQVVDAIELFVDTDYECKLMWNPNMNGGEYELLTRYSEDGNNPEWTEYISYKSEEIGTLAEDLMGIQDDIRKDIADRMGDSNEQ